jgi:hypothetical protein
LLALLPTVGHELAGSAVVAVGLALLFMLLGAGATAFTSRNQHGSWDFLSPCAGVALAVPVFVVAWIGWSHRHWLGSSRRVCVASVGVLALAAGMVNRFLLVGGLDGCRAEATMFGQTEAALRDFLFSVTAPERYVDAFGAMHLEVVCWPSHLWFTACAVVFASVVAYFAQPYLSGRSARRL